MNDNVRISPGKKTRKPAKRFDFRDFDDLTNWITEDITKQARQLARQHRHDETEAGLVAWTDALCRLIWRCPHPDQRAALAAVAIDKLRVLLIRLPPRDPSIVENASTALN
ncbi:MAG: hypothetical protein ABTR27_16260 [Candidatus Competibacter phosphatis]